MTMWKGILAATTTPFKEDGSLDHDAIAAHTERLVAAGCAGLVVNAVTGEGGSLTPEERAAAVRTTSEAARGRAVVIATAGSVGDYETIADIRNAANAGADGIMIIAPYFYRLSTAERVDYFVRMGGVSDLPYIVYNTTYANPMLNLDELEAIAGKSPRFVGLKEGQQTQASEAVRRLSPQVAVYTSRDTHISELGFAGGSGAVTYSSNIAPQLTVDLWNAVARRDHVEALEFQQRLNPIALAVVARSFPSAVKASMKMLGWDSGRLRTPIAPLEEGEAEFLRPILAELHPTLRQAA